jgi:subtilisin family serine protease
MTTFAPALAADGSIDREIPPSLDEIRLANPQTASGFTTAAKIESSLLSATGRQYVVVRLAEDSSAERAAAGDGAAAQRSQRDRVIAQQSDVAALARSLDGGSRVIAQTQRALNAIVLDIDSADLQALAANSAVVSINRVVDYELDLSETVPYIGATAVQDAGYDGTGVSVAVLDSGIDYTHANLGGSGDVAEYEANDPNVIEPGTFPTADVVGGYDFVGSVWPDGDLAPDPDPLDDGSQGGHGTHVADIIGGNHGVAPGVDLYAVKVCSSEATSCSGIALLQGMDFAVDPNGDGDTSDHVDVINMSLGSIYGQWYDDDLSQAVENASAIGTLTVASAGNSADKPYVTGTPAAAPSAVSVAQTQVPSAIQPLLTITSPDSIAGDYAGVFQPWSTAPTDVIDTSVIYGDGAGGNLDGCVEFGTDLSGYIVLVDRGTCSFTSKILNVEAAGGVAGIIGLVAPGDPFAGGYGGEGIPLIPGYMISQSDSLAIQGAIADGDTVAMTIDPAVGIPLIMHMVGSSARGPEISFNTIKPDIGAPGASVSAEFGTGTEETPFGGTSGAAPMVSGSAALLLQAYPGRSPAEIKSVLMNTGETDIMNIPEFFGGDLAPITRIGGGEVRVDAALAATAAAWDAQALAGSLSFGELDVWQSSVTLRRSVTVQNYGSSASTFDIASSFRFDDDADNGAVSISAPASVRVPAGGQSTFQVSLTVNGAALRDWGISSGSDGSSGDGLTVFEYDGYLDLTNRSNGEELHLAWQVLPRKADNVVGRKTVRTAFDAAAGLDVGTTTLTNAGVGDARIEPFSLIGRSPNLPPAVQGGQAPITDLRYVGVSTIPVPAGFCSADDSYVLRFAVNTWEDQAVANVPNAFEIDLDTNTDGVYDYAILNWDLGYPGIGDGRNVTWVFDLATGDGSAFFFTEHTFNSGNTVLTICGEQIGQNAANFFQPMTADVLAVDIYFQGAVTDAITGLQISPLGERYVGVIDTIPANGSGDLTVYDFGRAGTNPSESGLLLVTTASDGTAWSGARSEAIPIRVFPANRRGAGAR